MKKVVLSLMLTFVLTLGITMPALAAGGLPVFVEGQKIAEPALVKNGVSYLPMRAIYEAADAYVDWDAPSQTVVVRRDLGDYKETRTALPVNGKSAKLTARDGAELTVDYGGRKPFLQKGRVYLPVRLAAELMGYEVTWADGRVDIKERYLVNGTLETGLCRLDLRTGEVSQQQADGNRFVLGRLTLPSIDDPVNYRQPSHFAVSLTPAGNFLVTCEGSGNGMAFLYQAAGWISKASSTVKTCVADDMFYSLPKTVWTGSTLWLSGEDDMTFRIDDVTGEVAPMKDFGRPVWSDGRFVLSQSLKLYDTQTAQSTDLYPDIVTDEARATIDAWIKQDFARGEVVLTEQEYHDSVWRNLNNNISVDAHVVLFLDYEQDGRLYFRFGIGGLVLDKPEMQTLSYTLPK